MALLEARGLVKRYGRRAVVDEVDLDIGAGEIVGLLGPNGAGKTTIFRMMVGMISPQAGVVRFNGQDVTRMPMYRRARLGLGYLAQDSSVFRRLTVEQNLHAILELMTTRRGKPFRCNRAQRKERVVGLLEQFGLTGLAKNISITLSGGERRRLEIARCLVSEPMLIMLDEPFTGIDPKTIADIQQIVRDLCQSGISVLITDHNVAETLRITDHSYLVASGKTIAHGTPIQIVNDSRVREVYLGEQFNTAAIAEQHVQPIGTMERTESFSSSDPEQTQVIEPARKAKELERTSIRSLLDSEWIFEMIDQLGTENYRAAANQLQTRGEQVVLPLIEALERKDRTLRMRTHDLLCEIVGKRLPFDVDAHEHTRLKQINAIRRTIGRRNAG